jgi:CRP/FNR family transcriptional regulator
MMSTSARHPCGQVLPFRTFCHGCKTRPLCLPFDLEPEQERQLHEAMRRTGAYGAGERLFRQGAPFSGLHIVRSGSVKTQQVTIDGDVHLREFCLEGDLLGLDAIGSSTHPSEAVALQDTTTCILPYAELERLCTRIPPLQHWLLSRLGRRLQSYQRASGWTGRKDAENRVLRFFLDLQGRLAVRQRPAAGYYPLPMHKCDIALFLKITPETLSRTLGPLGSKRLVTIRGRTFRLDDVARARLLIGE